MKISVALAAYRGERFLGAQLGSILAQTHPPDEIIVADDSPDDRTHEVVETFSARAPGVITYVHNEVALEAAENFAKAISLCTGEVIFLSDQDDVWESNKIERMLARLEANPDAAGVFCDSDLTDENLIPTGNSHLDTRGFSRRERHLIARSAAPECCVWWKRFPGAGHNFAFRAKLKAKLFPFPALKNCHDSWIGYVGLCMGGWRVVNRRLTLFRQHADNVSEAGRRSGAADALHAVRQGAAQWNFQLYRALAERFPELTGPLAVRLRQRMRHAECRERIATRCFFVRIALIFCEIFTLRYFRYGRGWKSILTDLLLPSLR
ncbi:MAG: glycosyltransferase [Victivallaceae bacterium]|nr:glycosyltransferase [Victivallaceae bacterium]